MGWLIRILLLADCKPYNNGKSLKAPTHTPVPKTWSRALLKPGTLTIMERFSMPSDPLSYVGSVDGQHLFSGGLGACVQSFQDVTIWLYHLSLTVDGQHIHTYCQRYAAICDPEIPYQMVSTGVLYSPQILSMFNCSFGWAIEFMSPRSSGFRTTNNVTKDIHNSDTNQGQATNIYPLVN